jgi:hypothetical protein
MYFNETHIQQINSSAGPALGGVGPNAVLCKTCSVLLCVLEQPRVDTSSAGH